jgi:hypothetical protein
LFDLFSKTLNGLRCPASAIDPERGAIEMLGWLDVRNESASNIILVGFNDSGELGPAPSDGWLTDAVHTVAVEGAVGTDGRSQEEGFKLEFNTGRYAETDSKETAEGCECSHATAPRWGWLWLLPLLALRRR